MAKKDKEDKKEIIGEKASLFALIFIGLAIIAQWGYVHYEDNPFNYPWGSKTLTVSAEDLNLLPNEQQNYLGTRAGQDDQTELVYTTNNMHLTAASAFSIRTGPGVYYQSIGRMYYGRDVHVIATCSDNDWYMIDFYGDEAYVHSACLFEELPEVHITTRSEPTARDLTADEQADGELPPDPDAQEPGSPVTDGDAEATATPVPSSELTTTPEPTVTAEPTDAPEPTEEPEPSPTPEPTEAPTPTPAPAASAPTDPVMLELFNLVNNARIENGLAPLNWDNALAVDAAIRAQDISQVYGHTRPDGSEWYSIDPDKMYAENIASGQSTAQEVFNSWWASDGHRANMLRADFTSCGYAVYYSGDAGNTYYWVQEFGY